MDRYLKLSAEDLIFKSQNNQRKILNIDDLGVKKQEDLPQEFFKDIANDLYVEKFINSLLKHALNSKADTIFFDLSEKNLKISFRIFERNYDVINISREVWFSILTKFKY